MAVSLERCRRKFDDAIFLALPHMKAMVPFDVLHQVYGRTANLEIQNAVSTAYREPVPPKAKPAAPARVPAFVIQRGDVPGTEKVYFF